MQSNKLRLYVCTASHLCSRAYKNSYIAVADFCKHFCLCSFVLCFMDKCHFFSRNSLFYEFFTDIVINRYLADFLKCFICCIFSIIKVSFNFISLNVRNSHIAEYELCKPIFLSILPDIEYILNAKINFSTRFIGEHRIDKSLIKTALSSVIRNTEHIVH